MIANLRVVTTYKSAGTKSFRLSASKFDDYGMNLQNPDKHSLDMCIAPRGHLIVQADQSGAEALIVAEIAEPGRYRDLFDNGIKPHTYLAGDLFADTFSWPGDLRTIYQSGDIAALAAHPLWPALHATIKDSGIPYEIGKRTAHGASYKMGPVTFRDTNLKQSYGKLCLSIPECAKFLNRFKTLFPEIVEWQYKIELLLRTARRLTNLFGYEREFFRIITDGYVREAISWIPQSTVGCITHAGVRAARAEGLRVVSNKHDSYATIVREDEAKQVAQFMRTSLALEFQGSTRTFRMRSETQAGQNWATASKTNPLGMSKI